MKAKLTADMIHSLPLQAGAPLRVYDEDIKGFGLKVNRTTKTFFVEKRIDRKLHRKTIGQFPAMSLSYARKLAQKCISDLLMGVEVIRFGRAKSAQKSVTLAKAIEDYFSVRRKMTESTRSSARYTLNRNLRQWFDMPVLEITGKMVLDHHESLTKERGPIAANTTMRKLRAVLNVSKALYEKEVNFANWENPVKILGKVDAWNPSPRRTRVIPKEKLGLWFNTVLALREATGKQQQIISCDLLLFLLLTGLRRDEATRLTWKEVFRVDGYFCIPGSRTKNKQAHRLPFSEYLQGLIEKRWRERRNDYVFPGSPKQNPHGHIKNPIWTIKKACQLCDLEPLSPHDLRRTFSSLAEYLNFNEYTIKKLLNHRIDRDVTGGYLSKSFDADRLRKPMQDITDFILEQAGISDRLSRRVELFLNDDQLAWFQQQAEHTGESMNVIASKAIDQVISA